MKLSDLFDHFLIDLDGVVYVGDKLMVGAGETLATLRDLKKSVIFLTNDPRRSSREYAEKLSSMGVPASPQYVITSAMALAYYIKEHYQPNGKKAYVIGSRALKEEIEQIGLKLTEGEEARRAEFVIVGGHPGFNYEEMKLAALAVRDGAHFFGTNRDPVFPTPEGLVPATGAILASIEFASGKRAITAGKPELIMFEVAKKLLGVCGIPAPDEFVVDFIRDQREKILGNIGLWGSDKRGRILGNISSQERIAIIGDRLDTDIMGGKRAGIATIFVLSGYTDPDELSRSQITPDYVIRDLRDLLREQE